MIQLQVLNKILKDKDSSFIVDNNLDNSYFSDYQNEFNFIINHLNKYNSIPDLATFLNVFEDFTVLQVDEPDSYLLEKLEEDRTQRKLAFSFNKIRDLLMKDDTNGALNYFKSTFQDVSTSSSKVQCVDILKDTSRYDKYIERTQDYNKYYIRTGFKELDNIIGGWDREEELVVVAARTNAGKCLCKGTKILMADGSTKKVENVKVGDKVQSLNRINTVLALHNGVSKGYKIIPNVGEPFVISQNHILTIMELKEVWDRKRKHMVTHNEFELKDISIEEYLSYSNHKKHLCRLYYPKIEYEPKNLLIPPYIMGIWLGDGTSSRAEICSMDKEVIEEWKNYANLIGLKCTKRDKYSGNTKSKSSMYTLTHRHGKKNILLELLKYYNIFGNKNIPLDYITGDRQQRLEFLAGLLDSDGYYNKKNNTYEITFKSRDMIEKTRQLCCGLGYRVSVIQDKYVKKFNKIYYRINICGDFSELPVRVAHKKPHVITNYKRNLSLTNFKVEQVEKIEYYGFMCDGDERYILANGILTHNTWINLKMALEAVKQGLNVLLYSGEMSEKKVGYRMDTLISHIPNTSLIRGRSDVQIEYKKYIDSLSTMFKGYFKIVTPQMLNGPATVGALGNLIDKEKPDILFIDQHSLLEDQRKAKTPVERASNISRDLKNLQVMKRIPIISVSQLNRTKNEDDTIDTTQLSMSDRISQDATIIIGLSRDKKDKNLMSLQIVKARDAEAGRILKYNVDFNTGVYTYIPEEEDINQETMKEYVYRYKIEDELL